MYYYAVLDEKNIVINVYSNAEQQSAANLIQITETQYNDPDIVGLYYDAGNNEFITPPIYVLAETSTSKIQYKNENKWLDAKLDELDQAIENIELTPGPDGLSAYEVAQENGFTGTQAQWLASLVGQKGDPGATGATGPQGPAGTNGTNGTNGANGASAYEIAVANGFSGTQTEWLASLVGPQGATGPAGADGQDAASAFQNYSPTDFIDHDLQITSDTGAVKEVLNQNVTAQIAAKAAGVYTFSSAAGVAGAPTATEAYRYLAHKTTGTHGWVIAFGQSGTVYTNYINAGAWTGWKPVHTQETPLWSGTVQMTDTDTVTPSKALSDCAHGWVLMWSDYNVETSEPSETDIATTLVPKKNALGNNWTGQGLYALLPTYVTTQQAVTIACKRLNIYNNRITGFALNNSEPANDVVLRAIYEY